ncbi:MAG: acyl-[ACP]--phospholipid O-acyltransferase [Lactobacillaceae bacterium]|jgi:acyl-[acyl-carrier-protein]-phospholipid O-acyltransferase/long-chain-fatty-acid--[acyl-carrier-protein] ligase|nr:acyl-[ACP]--phospholipid O-acyltransferase [Lactobacillaceae bacterium]
MGKILSILKQRSFLSIFITQFLGAFNDNLFRAAMSGFVTYKITSILPEHKQIIVTLAVGLFMLPFFLFSAMAGEIADKYRKDVIFKITKFAEVIIALLAIYGFYAEDAYMLLGVLALMGTQSAFFGPAKYSVLPDVLNKDELIAGNGLFEAGSYLAILNGIIIGGLIMSGEGSGIDSAAVSVMSVSVIGLIASLFIPEIKPASPDTKINPNFIKSTFKNMKFATYKRNIFLCILGISWFWMIGAVLISQIPSYAENVLNADGRVYTWLLTLFSCGVGIGAITCQYLLKGEITGKYLPISSILMTVFLADLAWASSGVNFTGERQTLAGFITSFDGIRISLDLLLLAACGGLYMVPLNAMLQVFSGERIRSRVIATNNIINALFMVAGSVICVILLSSNWSIAEIFAIIAISNAFVTVYICGLMPEHIAKSIAKSIIGMFYKIEVKGLENVKDLKGEAVIVANHTSFLDGILLWAYLPSGVIFAINTFVAQEWWVRIIQPFVKYFTLDPTNPMSVKHIIEEVKKKNKVVIFPEGRITTTGTLMKVYPGPAVIADKSDANLLPIYIDGSQYSMFGRFSAKLKKCPKSKISINVFPARKLNVSDDLQGKDRRLDAATKLYDIMCEMKFASRDINKPIFASLVDGYNLVGGKKEILEDVSRKKLTYKKFLIGTFALGGKIAKITKKKEFLGLMLPNTNAVMVTFMGMQAYGRIPCMINFTSGVKSILSSCKTAKIKTIFTSRQFIEKAELQDLEKALIDEGYKLVYLEDLGKSISLYEKLRAMYKSFAPSKHIRRIDPNGPAVVLFTSGSEGTPKGVVLSHKNILANIQQAFSVIPIGVTDSVFSALPTFHSFGLSTGAILPLVNGIKLFLYPSPMHYKIVPELVYDTESTVMFGTDTFYAGYAKSAHPYDFHTMRFAIIGAEKLKAETYNAWVDKFGIRLLEGYGATETAPVLSLDTPMHCRKGTVGRLLPQIEHKLLKVPGIKEGGSLVVKGPNVMLGYLKVDKPGVIQPLKDGWYDTGDIVTMDEDGFISIQGRAKRFAKIAGEMISLTAVEGEIKALWKDTDHAVVSVADEKKGEQLVLFTTNDKAKRDEISEYFQKSGISELSVPKTIRIVEAIPIMGSGKVDYVKINEMAKELA